MAALMNDSDKPYHLYGEEVDYAVVGLGQTGQSAVDFLRAQDASVRVFDTREMPPALAGMRQRHPDVEVITGVIEAEQLARAGTIVLSPGFDPAHPAVARIRAAGATVIGDIELFARHADAPVIAITGTNGKSTVTTLVAHLLSAAGLDVRAGGNLGPPALTLLRGEPPDFYVLELSSFQLELTQSLRAAVACILNIAPDHLDRHGSIERYTAAKLRVVNGARAVVLNADDPRLAHAVSGAHVRRFGAGRPTRKRDYGLVRDDSRVLLAGAGGLLVDASQLSLRGEHNLANVLAALAIVDACAAPRERTLPALTRFAGLPHRAEYVATVDGIDFVDDSKATNPAAAAATISGLMGARMDGRTARAGVVIAGGESKGFDFGEFAAVLAAHAHAVVLIGRAADAIAQAIDNRVTVVRADSMAHAVGEAHALASSGQTVLLAPACASFDMFRDYADRGDAFRAAVETLGGTR